MTLIRVHPLGALLAAALLAVGCSDSNEPGGSLSADLRFVQAVREATGQVRAQLDDGAPVQLSFKESSGYRATTAGLHLAELRDDEGLLDSGDVLLSAGIHHTIAYVGPSRILTRGLVLTDEPGSPAAGSALVRVVHGAIQRNPEDLYVLASGETVDGSPTIPAFEYLDVSAYEDVPGGQVSIVLTEPSEPDSVRYDSGPISVPAGTGWTVLLIQSEDFPLTADIVVLEDVID